MNEIYMEKVYSPFEELMQYYDYGFYAYYFLTLIVIVNCIKAIVKSILVNNNPTAYVSLSYIELIVSVLAGLGLMSGVYFQGILADISPKYSEIYWGQILVLSIIALTLFILQLILTLRIKIINNRKKNYNYEN